MSNLSAASSSGARNRSGPTPGTSLRSLARSAPVIDELRQFASLVGKANQVRSVDITEIDAMADSADGRTVRLGSLAILEIASGYQSR